MFREEDSQLDLSRTERNCGNRQPTSRKYVLPSYHISPDGHMGIPGNAHLAGLLAHRTDHNVDTKEEQGI
jgi:hypothetical protein